MDPTNITATNNLNDIYIYPSHLLALFWEHFQQIYECNAKEISHSLTHYPRMDPEYKAYRDTLFAKSRRATNLQLDIVAIKES